MKSSRTPLIKKKLTADNSLPTVLRQCGKMILGLLGIRSFEEGLNTFDINLTVLTSKVELF